MVSQDHRMKPAFFTFIREIVVIFYYLFKIPINKRGFLTKKNEKKYTIKTLRKQNNKVQHIKKCKIIVGIVITNFYSKNFVNLYLY